MTYLEEALMSDIVVDQIYNEEILEQLDVEQDFMISCLENNIILEAENPSNTNNKGGWLTSIKTTIKNIFNKFLEVVTELFRNDEKWIKENLAKIPSINFKGLKVTTLAYNEVNIESIKRDLQNMQNGITKYKPSDTNKLNNLQSREQVEKADPFRNYNMVKDLTFADRIKIYFKTGEGYEPKQITLEDDALKNMCVGEMSKYVSTYNSAIAPALKQSYSNFDRLLAQVEKDIANSKSANVKESFCLIENAYYSDTELKLCSNYNAIFEAEAPVQNNTNNTNTNNNDNKPALHKVEDTIKDDKEKPVNSPNGVEVAKDASTEYYNYVKIAIQLNQTALTAAMTACEEKYRAYMSILRSVISERGKK